MKELKTYRVYGLTSSDYFDEYVEATSAQTAVDMVRDWHKHDGEFGYSVLEVARIVKGWK